MTTMEFMRWKDRFFVAFPGMLSWLKNTSTDTEATLGEWYKSLAKTEVQDAMTAVDKLLDGSEPPIERFQEGNAPLRIRAIAEAVRRERSAQATQKRLSTDARQPRQPEGATCMLASQKATSVAQARRHGRAIELNVPDHDAMKPEEYMAIYDGVVIDELHKMGLHNDAAGYRAMRRDHGGLPPVMPQDSEYDQTTAQAGEAF